MSAFRLNLAALPLVYLASFFALLARRSHANSGESAWEALTSDWLTDYDAAEREIFESVQRILEERARDDARHARQQRARQEHEATPTDLYALLAQPPPRGTPCFDEEMGATCAICLDEYEGAAPCAGKAVDSAATGSTAERWALRRCGLGCGHGLHVRCAAELIKRSAAGARCPLCREPLVQAGQWQRTRTRRDVVGNFFA